MDGLPGLGSDQCRGFAERELGHDGSRGYQLFDFFNAQIIGSWNHRSEHYSLSMLQPTDGVCNRVVKTANMERLIIQKFFLDWLPRAILRAVEYFPAQEFSIQRSGAS